MVSIAQALSIAEQERMNLQEKFASVQRELANAMSEHARQKREMQGHHEHQANNIGGLQSELNNFRAHIEQMG